MELSFYLNILLPLQLLWFATEPESGNHTSAGMITVRNKESISFGVPQKQLNTFL